MAVDLLRPETLSGPIQRMRNDNVLVRVLPRAEQEGYSGALVLPEVRNREKPENADKKTMWCMVVQCGPKATDLNPGDKVLVTLLAGDRIWIAGYEHRVVRYEEILCVEEAGGDL